MTQSLDKALAYAREHDARFVEEIAAWCRIPSVSSQAEHKPDMQRAAEWGAERLRRAGLQNVAILPTAGHPVVYGDWLGAGAGQADGARLRPLRRAACPRPVAVAVAALRAAAAGRAPVRPGRLRT